MPDPFTVLNLSATASAQEVRARYLELAQQFPPDSAPDRFAEIRTAYDELSDPREWLRKRLFESTEDSLTELIVEENMEARRRVPTDVLLQLGRDPC